MPLTDVGLPKPAVWRRLFWLVASLAAAAGLLWFAGAVATERAEEALRLRTSRTADLFDGLLAREVARHRVVPSVLAMDPTVMRVLADRRSDAALDQRLQLLNRQMDEAAVYAISADGVARAASNAATPDSFVGHDYRFRRYFLDAMANGESTEFALGSTTRRPGLYLANRVGPPEAPLGVVVVKVELQSLEAEWARSGIRVAVSDPTGRVLLTSVAGWRFQTLAQAGLAPPTPDLRLVVRPASAVEGWRLNLAASSARELGAARRQGQLLAAAAMALLGSLGFVVVRRVRARRAETGRQARAKAELERRVADRTAKLSTINARLRDEMEERRRAEEEASLLHRELEQANRLATLGQIAAGVTHEISQPVAAIRASAHNAGVSLERGDRSGATDDLAVICNLTDRIGAITGELRSFSRKGGDRSATLTPVDDAIDGALLLLSSRLRRADVGIERPVARPDMLVNADRVRLEQILVNLIQNALDAQGTEAPQPIRISVDREEGGLAVRVTDFGEGISPEMADRLFTPFRTSRPDGLGLGLVISREIATTLGGTLDHEPGADAGTVFRLWLPAA